MHAWVSPFAVGEAIQGAGYSDIYVGQGFNCTGQEYGLSECYFNNATDNCSGRQVAGVRCTQSELSMACYLITI